MPEADNVSACNSI